MLILFEEILIGNPKELVSLSADSSNNLGSEMHVHHHFRTCDPISASTLVSIALTRHSMHRSILSYPTGSYPGKHIRRDVENGLTSIAAGDDPRPPSHP
jgi:hypothetical protein